MEFDIKTVSKEEETIIIPAHNELPSIRYDLQNPIARGDKIDIVIRINDEDVDVMSFIQDQEVSEGKEIRAFIQFAAAEMQAFTSPMDAPRVLGSQGEVSVKAITPIEEIKP